MDDPGLQDWREVGVPVREVHTDFAESAQGVATDGRRWFIVSNRATVGLMRKITNPHTIFGRYRNSRRVGVYRIDGVKERELSPSPEVWAELVRLNRRDHPTSAIHLGAPGWARDCLLVPTQRPSGVWVVSDDLARQDWWPDPTPSRPERYSWIAEHTDNGLLYTSLHHHPRELQAVEWQTLARRPSADIKLTETQPLLHKVQGGAFTGRGRVLLTSSNAGGQLFCYSAATGESLGVLEIGTYFELEGIAVAPVQVNGQLASVHLLEAATDYWPFVRWGDSFFLRSYRVPRPDEL